MPGHALPGKALTRGTTRCRCPLSLGALARGGRWEQFKTSDGKVLLDTQVQNLVDAMAAFVMPLPGQTTLPASLQSSLNPVIAANWL